MTRLITALALILPLPLAAHAPMIAEGDLSREAPFQIDDPEHSKAIYGELNGSPEFYTWTADEPFDFYVGLTAPRVEGCPISRTFSAQVTNQDGEVVADLVGDGFEWWAWFEEFGKRWYWVGPETGVDFRSDRQMPAGTYTVKVYNDANDGHYVLAIGDDERFGPAVLASLPRVSRQSQAWWEAVDCNS